MKQLSESTESGASSRERVITTATWLIHGGAEAREGDGRTGLQAGSRKVLAMLGEQVTTARRRSYPRSARKTISSEVMPQTNGVFVFPTLTEPLKSCGSSSEKPGVISFFSSIHHGKTLL